MKSELTFVGLRALDKGTGIDASLDIKLPNPHPAAEKLFAAAWSACFIGAIELAASRKKTTLPAHPSIDAEIDLMTADDAFFLRARLNVSVPGVDRDLARELTQQSL
jgi:lipoyl-dependent peroxiredoxin